MRGRTTKRRRISPARTTTSSWLPIDTRIFPDIIRFGHVRGLSRIFLTVEIYLVTFVVIGTFVLAFLKIITGL